MLGSSTVMNREDDAPNMTAEPGSPRWRNMTLQTRSSNSVSTQNSSLLVMLKTLFHVRLFDWLINNLFVRGETLTVMTVIGQLILG